MTSGLSNDPLKPLKSIPLGMLSTGKKELTINDYLKYQKSKSFPFGLGKIFTKITFSLQKKGEVNNKAFEDLLSKLNIDKIKDINKAMDKSSTNITSQAQTLQGQGRKITKKAKKLNSGLEQLNTFKDFFGKIRNEKIINPKKKLWDAFGTLTYKDLTTNQKTLPKPLITQYKQYKQLIKDEEKWNKDNISTNSLYENYEDIKTARMCYSAGKQYYGEKMAKCHGFQYVQGFVEFLAMKKVMGELTEEEDKIFDWQYKKEEQKRPETPSTG